MSRNHVFSSFQALSVPKYLPRCLPLQTYVCTLSQRDYAHEIWRLLDPLGELIPPREVRQRVVAVPPHSRKKLGAVLHAMAPRELAIIVDDRPEVLYPNLKPDPVPYLNSEPTASPDLNPSPDPEPKAKQSQPSP